MVERAQGGYSDDSPALPRLWGPHSGRRGHRLPGAPRQRPVRDATWRAVFLHSSRRVRASTDAGRPRGGSDARRASRLKRTRRPLQGAPCRIRCRGGLELDDVLRRGALLALHDFELDALAFGQRLEPLTLNRGVMHEAVLAAVFGRDETETLAVVEPLHGTGNTCHLSVTPS